MLKQIILTADDYGCSDFIDAGVHEALDLQKINSVAAFVTHADSRARITNLVNRKKKFLAANNPAGKFGIGLHFSITSGKPITGKSSLTFVSSDAEKASYFKEAAGYDFLLTEPDDIRRELRAQLDEIRDILKDEPVDHLSHHHGYIYLEPGLFDVYTDELKMYNRKNGLDIAMRSPVSWFRKFGAGPDKSKKTGDCKDCFEKLEKKIITPAGIEGITLMMWKKYFQSTYGIMKKRMNLVQDTHRLRSPELLCDIIYGQANEKTLNAIFSNFQNNQLLDCAGFKDFSAELMFHFGSGDWKSQPVPHGVNPGYFDGRISELAEIKKFDLDHMLEITKTKKALYADIPRKS